MGLICDLCRCELRQQVRNVLTRVGALAPTASILMRSGGANL